MLVHPENKEINQYRLSYHKTELFFGSVFADMTFPAADLFSAESMFFFRFFK